MCSDHSGLSAIDGLEVVVYPRCVFSANRTIANYTCRFETVTSVSLISRPFSERFGAEFWLRFSSDISRHRVRLVEEILPDYFGDRGAGQVRLTFIIARTCDWGNLADDISNFFFSLGSN